MSDDFTELPSCKSVAMSGSREPCLSGSGDALNVSQNHACSAYDGLIVGRQLTPNFSPVAASLQTARGDECTIVGTPGNYKSVPKIPR